MGHKGQIRQL